ncbi:hypothetical protein ABBQ32_000563 [Trebouxia sp. C0010 RCD-2024]
MRMVSELCLRYGMHACFRTLLLTAQNWTANRKGMLKVIRSAAPRAIPNVSVVLCQTTRSASAAASATPAGGSLFDTGLLNFLVCPLSKGILRYSADKQELVSDDIGVAYPIVAGIPRLVPTVGRLIDAANAIPGSKA